MVSETNLQNWLQWRTSDSLRLRQLEVLYWRQHSNKSQFIYHKGAEVLAPNDEGSRVHDAHKMYSRDVKTSTQKFLASASSSASCSTGLVRTKVVLVA